MRRALVALAAMTLLASSVDARPAPRSRARTATKVPTKRIPPAKKGAAARIAIARAGELRVAREVVGRREEPLTAEEETAKEIAKVLRGPLRNGLTALFVADARTGKPLFAINAEEPVNPASNVKMISTATALELLGPEFRYPTRLLGPSPVDGVVHGDVYLLGSHDPTLTVDDLDDIATEVSARGITSITGRILVGADPTRDGIYRASIPIEITAGEPGEPPTAVAPVGADHVAIVIKAKTSRRARRPRLTYKTVTTKTALGLPLITLTISGTIGKGRSTTHRLRTRARTATAGYALRAALRSHTVAMTGDLAIAELGDFIGSAVGVGDLPIELGRHQSRRLADIVRRINKWSVNWLADRVIMTAAALTRRAPPSMAIALDAMYAWLGRNAHLSNAGLVIDTGSGLSYKTRITPQELVAVIRSAGGFANAVADPSLARVWLESLSIAGSDGTLRHRVRGADAKARIRGKSGTLSTVIAMSGVLDIDPTRPLAFSLVTNTDTRIAKKRVRRAHDQLMALLCRYAARTAASRPAAPASVVEESADGVDEPTDEPDDSEESEAALDAEAASS